MYGSCICSELIMIKLANMGVRTKGGPIANCAHAIVLLPQGRTAMPIVGLEAKLSINIYPV